MAKACVSERKAPRAGERALAPIAVNAALHRRSLRVRDLGELGVRYLFLDGWYPRVRIGKKRVRVPVLVTLGVCANGYDRMRGSYLGPSFGEADIKDALDCAGRALSLG